MTAIKLGSPVRVNLPGHRLDGLTGTLEYVSAPDVFVKYRDIVDRLPVQAIEVREACGPLSNTRKGDCLEWEEHEELWVDPKLGKWWKEPSDEY